MAFSSDGTNWTVPESYAATKAWTMGTGDGVKTVYVKFRDGVGNWSNAFTTTITLDTVLPETLANPSGGTYGTVRSVTLTANETATIYYTLDGTEPTTSSSVYGTPIPVTSSLTLKYFAKDLAGNAGNGQEPGLYAGRHYPR